MTWRKKARVASTTELALAGVIATPFEAFKPAREGFEAEGEAGAPAGHGEAGRTHDTGLMVAEGDAH
jgi:hypothetical protein